MKRVSFVVLLGLSTLNMAGAIDTAACRYNRAQEVKGVYPAKDGVIVYDSELFTDWSSWLGMTDKISKISKILLDNGIKLIVMPVPTRIMVNPEILRTDVPTEKGYFESSADLKYLSLVKAFRSSDINTLDLLGPLRGKAPIQTNDKNYFLQEFHWTQTGALIAASKLAESIKNIQGISINNTYSIFADGVGNFEPVLPLRELSKLCVGKSEDLPYTKITTLKAWQVSYPVFSSEERNSKDVFRWAIGPESRISFLATGPKNVSLSFRVDSPIRSQSMKVYFNKKIIYSFDEQHPAGTKTITLNLDAQKGINDVTFVFSEWNHKSPASTFAAADPRTLAVNFKAIELRNKNGTSIDGSETSASSSLLGDEVPPITLIGTSYSSYMDLAGLLRATTGNDVLDVTMPAGGIFTPMQKYLEGSDIKNNKPKVIVWEMPMMWSISNYREGLDKIISDLKF